MTIYGAISGLERSHAVAVKLRVFLLRILLGADILHWANIALQSKKTQVFFFFFRFIVYLFRIRQKCYSRGCRK